MTNGLIIIGVIASLLVGYVLQPWVARLCTIAPAPVRTVRPQVLPEKPRASSIDFSAYRPPSIYVKADGRKPCDMCGWSISGPMSLCSECGRKNYYTLTSGRQF